MIALAIATLLLLFGPAAAVFTTFDNILTNDTINAEFISTNFSSLDGPKLGYPGPANDTSYDWWYFDAVSASSNASVTVVFYNSGPDGFINSYLGGPLSVSIIGTFANGTVFDLSVPASGVEIEHGPHEGISLDFVDSGFKFTGSNLKHKNVKYVVNIDSPTIGVKGRIRFHSRAPAHYPCGPNTAGSNLQMLPHVGWSNAVPDAHATVSLHFAADNTTLAFKDGVGYHDKNWGDQPFVASTELWYWGHARLGPYSLVWFDAFAPDGTEYFSGYVAADGAVRESSCVAGASVARPWGVNGAFPLNATTTTGVPQGVEVVFALGGGEVLRANVTTGTVVVDGEGVYLRTLGTVVGGVEGGKVYKGRALFEQFDLLGGVPSS